MFEIHIWELRYDNIQNGDEKMNDTYAERKRSAGVQRTHT